MMMMSEAREDQRDLRLALKTQDQALMREAMEGAGLTRWAALFLPRVVEKIYFHGGSNRPWKDGQVRYQCVSLKEGAGKKLAECALVPVALSVIDVEKDREVLHRDGAVGLRRSKLMRIAEEAREQGGVLTQEDLGVLLACDERTVRRDIAYLRKQGIHVPTRGYLQDIGPTLSHKGLAIRHWLEGKEPVSIARAINHSLAAVERYLEDFKRVSLCTIKGLDATATSCAVCLSPTLVGTYRTMYEEARANPAYQYRFTELSQLLAGETAASNDEEPAAHTAAGKKGGL